jgi:hypothetical protein
LSVAANATIGTGQAVGTIVNDDSGPVSLSVSNVLVIEGNGGTTAAVLTVTLSSATPQTVSLTYATADGTATAAGHKDTKRPAIVTGRLFSGNWLSAIAPLTSAEIFWPAE